MPKGENLRKLTPEQEAKRRKGVSVACKGIPCSEERKQKLRDWYSRQENREKQSKRMSEYYQTHENKGKETLPRYAELRQRGLLPWGSTGRKMEPEEKERRSVALKKAWEENPQFKTRQAEITKKMWDNPEYVKKVRTRRLPTKLEFEAIELLKQHASEFKYVGDFKFRVGKKWPDFWNGDHKLIEIFGYYHNYGDDIKRISYFQNFGYDCLVIWASEMSKKNISQTIDKIKLFVKREES